MIPLFLLPFFPHSLLLPIRFPSLTWNPPCCDRIRPPRSQVARKLDSPFPSPCAYTPHSRILTPWGFSHPNIHSLGRLREPGSQDPAQYQMIHKPCRLHSMSGGTGKFWILLRWCTFIICVPIGLTTPRQYSASLLNSKIWSLLGQLPTDLVEVHKHFEFFQFLCSNEFQIDL